MSDHSQSNPSSIPPSLGKRFRLHTIIRHESAMGATVYQARDRRSADDVLVVLCDNEHCGSCGDAQDGIPMLVHPNLVDVVAHQQHGERPYLVFALPQGETLSSIVARRGRYDAASFGNIGRQLLRAVAYLHDQGWVHGDLHPSSIFVAGDDPSTARVVLTGTYGCSRAQQPVPVTDTEQTRIAPHPERAPRDLRDDVLALGMLLRSVLELKADALGRTDMVRTRLRALCDRCTSSRRAERPASAAELLSAFSRCYASSSSSQSSSEFHDLPTTIMTRPEIPELVASPAPRSKQRLSVPLVDVTIPRLPPPAVASTSGVITPVAPPVPTAPPQASPPVAAQPVFSSQAAPPPTSMPSAAPPAAPSPTATPSGPYPTVPSPTAMPSGPFQAVPSPAPMPSGAFPVVPQPLAAPLASAAALPVMAPSASSVVTLLPSERPTVPPPTGDDGSYRALVQSAHVRGGDRSRIGRMFGLVAAVVTTSAILLLWPEGSEPEDEIAAVVDASSTPTAAEQPAPASAEPAAPAASAVAVLGPMPEPTTLPDPADVTCREPAPGVLAMKETTSGPVSPMMMHAQLDASRDDERSEALFTEQEPAEAAATPDEEAEAPEAGSTEHRSKRKKRRKARSKRHHRASEDTAPSASKASHASHSDHPFMGVSR